MTSKPRTEGRINTDYGVRDYYKYYKGYSTTPVDVKKFNKVMYEFNKAIVDMIINDSLEYKPTTLQMSFCVRKAKRIPRIKDNKLINTNPIDWKSTKDLWLVDEEAADKKILIRHLNNHTSKYVFKIKILKAGIYYKNKKLFRFKACRSFQRSLAKRILDPEQDNFQAFNLY